MSRHLRCRGLTMIETVISLIIVASLGVAALRAFSAATLSRALAQDRARGVALARDLMQEVAAAPYGEPPATPNAAENRLAFDTVGDYHGWSASPPLRSDGTPVAAVPWRREVIVRPVELDGATAAAAASGLLRITVRVLKAERLVATEVGLRSAAWDPAIGGGP